MNNKILNCGLSSLFRCCRKAASTDVTQPLNTPVAHCRFLFSVPAALWRFFLQAQAMGKHSELDHHATEPPSHLLVDHLDIWCWDDLRPAGFKHLDSLT
ncbi:hypothetical protein XENOCAPTIV_002027 [Xenoophorus captivus]|uniref:Uncharacterized protein n=1 Tax=Xenoophorus captivus TaxID=1517983 RepID=A0ABV0RG88_9TELE